MEYPGACYHVINRGNFREWIFESDGAKRSFLRCLKEACEASGWILHAWCLMGNHYHLALETPQGNLVGGMRWLQSTFSNRFNRYRGENGHVFQGRYKAIVLDEEGLEAVCHYIHLNPVRAGLVNAGELESYEWSSFWQLWRPRLRWKFQDFETLLKLTGSMADTSTGRRKYRDYLNWLSSDLGAQKELGFEQMTRGWAKGTKAFRQSLLARCDVSERRAVETEVREVREHQWESTVAEALVRLEKDAGAIESEHKGAPWKVALARLLRDRHLAPNAWIAERLGMGRAGTVSQYVNRHRREQQCDPFWEKLKNAKMLD